MESGQRIYSCAEAFCKIMPLAASLMLTSHPYAQLYTRHCTESVQVRALIEIICKSPIVKPRALRTPADSAAQHPLHDSVRDATRTTGQPDKAET